jgi:hypothetical protein
VRPPERLDRLRPAGRHKKAQRQLQYIQTLDELVRGPSVVDRLLGRPPPHRQKKLLLRALQIAAQLATVSVPEITLGEDRCLRQSLRCYKRRGMLGTTNLTADDMTSVKYSLTSNLSRSIHRRAGPTALI